MRATILASALLATSATAAPSWWRGGYSGSNCMSDSEAYQVANNFADLISAYTDATAEAVLTTDVQDYSDSVIELIDGGCPAGTTDAVIALGSATFDSLADFEAGQSGQPNITFDILNVWHNCDTVTLRWRSPMPNPGNTPAPAVQEQVTGIIVLETTFVGYRAPQPYLINTVYSEFNSAAWLYDVEVFTPTDCDGSVNATTKRRNAARSLPAYLYRAAKKV